MCMYVCVWCWEGKDAKNDKINMRSRMFQYTLLVGSAVVAATAANHQAGPPFILGDSGFSDYRI